MPSLSARTVGALTSWGAPVLSRPVMRNEMRLLVLLIGFLNAVMFQIADTVNGLGAFGAVADTFGISAVVWIALFVAASLLAGEPDRPATAAERRVALALAVLFLFPFKYVGWIGLTAFALTLAYRSRTGSAAARGAWILLAITVPMFWSKLVFSLLSGTLLQADAVLVSLVLGRPRLGNVITLADGHSHLWIAAQCSSMANLSLVVLAWALFRHAGPAGYRLGAGWGVVCGGVIVAINVGRISLIGLYPAHYDLLHGAVGATVASWLIVIAILAVFGYGVRRAV